MKSRRLGILWGALVFLTGGAILQRLIPRSEPPAHGNDLPAMVGGYRTMAADCLWLETNLAWEIRNEAEVRRLIDFTVKSDPHSPYFWLNGARILAYDLPAWRCQQECAAPLSVQASWRERGADEALLLLERGQHWHGKSAALHLEMANICLYALGDRHRAAEYYRLASEQSDAPGYAARIYGRLHEEEIAGMTLTR